MVPPVILVVEDNPITRKSVAVALECEGLRVLEAPDGRSALEWLEREQPDLILQDLALPDTDGRELVGRLRSRLKRRVPILAFTGSPELVAREGSDDGFDGVLSKPVGPSALRETVQSYLHRGPARDTRRDAGRRALAERLAQREAELAILADFLEGLRRHSPVEAVLDELFFRCLDASGTSLGLAYARNVEGRLSLRCRFGYGESEPGPADFFGHLAFLHEVAANGESVILSARQSGPQGLLERARAQSMILTPVPAGRPAMGVVVMMSADEELHRERAAFSRAVASQIRLAADLGRALAELGESRQRLAHVVETLSEGVIIADREGRPTVVNAAARWVHEQAGAELKSLWWTVMDSGEAVHDREIDVSHPERGRRVVTVTCVPLQAANGEPAGVVSSLLDVTEARRQAQELERSNAELERFAYVVAHDLKEPLRTVAGMSQLVARRYTGQLDDRADVLLSRMAEAATRMQKLIDDLLSYSRLGVEVRTPAPVSSEEVFQTALANLQEAIERNGGRIVHSPLPVVRADAVGLTRVFQNLLANALKFRGPEAPQVRVRALPGDGEWIFEVQDNGIGIDPKDAERIFRVFERVHGRDDYEGSGIGLAACKKIIERYGGRIWVQSEPGRGAIFRFSLPAADAVAAGSDSL